MTTVVCGLVRVVTSVGRYQGINGISAVSPGLLVLLRSISQQNTGNNQQVPLRPEEPQYCCGNGCQNCVWTQYAKDMEEYEEEMRLFMNSSTQSTPTQTHVDSDPSLTAFLNLERELAAAKSQKMSKENQNKEQGDNTGIQEFLKLEQKLAQQRKNKKKTSSNVD
eukprot:m.153470 g.153470  ORF g.153470 m.153470 type:complete len:165 (-) comp13309_c1_seq1:8670-9164(-)